VSIGDWKAANLVIQSTGLYDIRGEFAGGNITVPATLKNAVSGTPTTVSLTAVHDLQLDVPVTPTTGLLLHAGNALKGAAVSTTITVSGSGSFVDVSTSTNLALTSVSANGPITLTSTGTRGSGGNVTVSGTITAGAGLVTINSTGTGSAVSGVISGTGGLKFQGFGTGVLTLSAVNTWTGATTVDAGRVVITGRTAAGASITVINGGTLSGTGTMSGPVTAQTSGIVSSGTATVIGTLKTGNLSLTADSVFAAKYSTSGNVYSYDQTNVTGSVSLGGAELLTQQIGATLRVTKGDTFVVINNDGTDAITGRFTSSELTLEDGGQIRNFAGTGQRANIYYTASIDANGNVAKNPDGSLILNGNDVVILVDPKEMVTTIAADTDKINVISLQAQSGTLKVIDDGVEIDSAATSEAQALTINTIAGDIDNLKLDFDANPELLSIQNITINMNSNFGDLHDDLTIVMNGQSLTIELTSASSGTIEIPNGPRISFTGISQNTLIVGGTSDLVLSFDSTMTSLVFSDIDADGVGGLNDGWFRATDNLGSA